MLPHFKCELNKRFREKKTALAPSWVCKRLLGVSVVSEHLPNAKNSLKASFGKIRFTDVLKVTIYVHFVYDVRKMHSFSLLGKQC